MTDSPSSFSSECKAILVIDAHDSDRLDYAECLKVRSPEYAVFQTINGQAGLDLCNAHPMDCVVLELELPDMSGFNVLAKLNSLGRWPDMAVIILTRLDNQVLLEGKDSKGEIAENDEVCHTASPGGRGSLDPRRKESK